MKKEEMSFFDWQARFATEKVCKDYLYHEKWPNGFQWALRYPGATPTMAI